MPEGPEIDTDKLHETIQEQLEREGSALLRKIALTTALLAALAAIAALGAGATVNEALVLKTEAARLQSEGSNQWAYYQAKGIKAAVQEASRAIWLASSDPSPRAPSPCPLARWGRGDREVRYWHLRLPLMIDPNTGAGKTISTGGFLNNAFRVAVGPRSAVYILSSAGLVNIDVTSGAQDIV